MRLLANSMNFIAASLLPGLALAAALGLAPAAALAGSVTVQDEVRDALAAGGELRVVIGLEAGASRSADAQAQLDAALRSVAGLDARVQQRFKNIPIVAAVIDADLLDALERSGQRLRIELDAGGEGHMEEARPLAQVSTVQLAGLTGLGQKVVIMDSGLRLDHISFGSRIIDQACFCATVNDGSAGCCPNGLATQLGTGAAADDHGHGTNVGGIAVGAAISGGASVPAGVATRGDIVAVKVLTSTNSFFFTSEILRAYEWVRANHPDATVINASLGTSARFIGDCDTGSPLREGFASSIAALRAQGTLTTVSSGNNGISGEMQLPACSSASLSVGAVYDAAFANIGFGSVCTATNTVPDQMACFSNLSTTTDLTAPGALITSAGFGSSGATSSFQGTSMAAPMVAGCIALLQEAVPAATPAAIEQALEASPTRVARPGYAVNYPRLDCASALENLLDAYPSLFANGFEAP